MSPTLDLSGYSIAWSSVITGSGGQRLRFCLIGVTEADYTILKGLLDARGTVSLQLPDRRATLGLSEVQRIDHDRVIVGGVER